MVCLLVVAECHGGKLRKCEGEGCQEVERLQLPIILTFKVPKPQISSLPIKYQWLVNKKTF